MITTPRFRTAAILLLLWLAGIAWLCLNAYHRTAQTNRADQAVPAEHADGPWPVNNSSGATHGPILPPDSSLVGRWRLEEAHGAPTPSAEEANERIYQWLVRERDGAEIIRVKWYVVEVLTAQAAPAPESARYQGWRDRGDGIGYTSAWKGTDNVAYASWYLPTANFRWLRDHIDGSYRTGGNEASFEALAMNCPARVGASVVLGRPVDGVYYSYPDPRGGRVAHWNWSHPSNPVPVDLHQPHTPRQMVQPVVFPRMKTVLPLDGLWMDFRPVRVTVKGRSGALSVDEDAVKVVMDCVWWRVTWAIGISPSLDAAEPTVLLLLPGVRFSVSGSTYLVLAADQVHGVQLKAIE
ncbi:MAG: hypothetical protein AB7K09_18830 [Planctomycetota bacterium]